MKGDPVLFSFWWEMSILLSLSRERGGKELWISFGNQFLGGNKTINFYSWQKKISSPVIIITNQFCIAFAFFWGKNQLNLPLKWTNHLGFFLAYIKCRSSLFCRQVELTLLWALLNGHGMITNKNETNYSHSCLSEVCPNMRSFLEEAVHGHDLH